jgi:hypothetical protein
MKPMLMKNRVTKSISVTMAVAIGVALVAPALMAGPASVNGTLGGFSANAQGGQNPGDWGIPQGNGQNSQTGGGQQGPGEQNSQSGGGQNAAGQGKGPDAGGYGGQGNGQNSQSGGGQQGPGEQNSQSGGGQNAAGQGKGPDAGGYGGQGNGQNSQTGGGQQGPGEQNSQSGSGEGEHANDGPTKNNSNNPNGDGSGSGQGEHYDDGPTKNNSNNPDDSSGSAQGEHSGDGPTGGDRGRHGNGNGNGSGSGSGSNGGGDFPPLDPSADGQYDPANNGGDQQIPSGCAEAGSVCAQCVQRNENVVQFNRRYLHVAWSTTHQTLEYTKQAIAFGDAVSGIHSTQALAWQLAGKPQITEAVASLRKTYDNKYRIYINNMEQALNAMNDCEQDNFAVRDLYQRFSSLYLEFVKARYQSPD